MPDNFKKVRPNEDVVINAQTWNAMIDAAKAEARRKLNYEQDTNEQSRQSGYILVKNQTGRALKRFSVMGLEEPIFLPSVAENAFKQGITFRATVPLVPQHRGKFCVLIDPLDVGKIGRARVSDLAQVKVDIVRATDTCCDVQEGDTEKLISLARGGSAQIIWYEGWETGTTGIQWAVIRIGTGCKVSASSSSSSSSSTSSHKCREACKQCHPATGGCVMHFSVIVEEWDFIEPQPSCTCMAGFYDVFHQSGCTWINTTGPAGSPMPCGYPPPTVTLTGSGSVWTLTIIDVAGHSIVWKAPPGSFTCQNPVGGDLHYVGDTGCLSDPASGPRTTGVTCEGVG